MRRTLVFLFSLLAVSLANGGTVNVTYTFTDFLTAPVSVQRAVLTPLTPFADYNGALLVPRPAVQVTGTNGSCTFSNVVTGYTYTIELDTPYLTKVWTNGFPSTLSGNVSGRDYLGVWVDKTSFAFFYQTNSVGGITAGTNLVASTNNGVVTISAPNVSTGIAINPFTTTAAITNLIPAGAMYNYNDTFYGSYAYFLTGLNTNLYYYFDLSGADGATAFDDTNNYNHGIVTTGFFKPTNSIVEIISSFSDAPTHPVTIGVYTTNYAAPHPFSRNNIPSIVSFGAKGSGASADSQNTGAPLYDDTAAFQAAANSGGPVWIDSAMSYTITNQIVLTNGTQFYGQGAHVKAKNLTNGTMFLIPQSITSCRIDGLWIDGGRTGVAPYTANTGSTNVTRVVPNPANLLSGITIDSTTRNNFIVNCLVSGCSDAGIRAYGESANPTPSSPQLTIANNQIQDCWLGIDACSNAEYIELVGNNFGRCGRAINIAAGNVSVVGGVITYSGEGIRVNGTGVNNPAHSYINGVTANHCYLPVVCEGFANGFNFTGCYFLAATPGLTNGPFICLTNTTGVNFTACTLSGTVIASGHGGGGPNYIFSMMGGTLPKILTPEGGQIYINGPAFNNSDTSYPGVTNQENLTVQGNLLVTSNLTASGNITNLALTASQFMATDANKALTSTLNGGPLTNLTATNIVGNIATANLSTAMSLGTLNFNGAFAGPGYNMLTTSTGALLCTTATNGGAWGVDSSGNLWAANVKELDVTDRSEVVTNLLTAGSVTVNSNLTTTNITAPAASGSNIPGTNLVISAGVGTGNATNGAIIFKNCPVSGGSGSTANLAIPRYYASPHAVVMTSGNASNVFSLTLSTGGMASVRIFYSIFATNATDFATYQQTTYTEAVNKAGTVSASAAVNSNTGTATVGTGGATITSGASITAAGNVLTYAITPTVTGITATSVYVEYILEINSNDSNLTITPF